MTLNRSPFLFSAVLFKALFVVLCVVLCINAQAQPSPVGVQSPKPNAADVIIIPVGSQSRSTNSALPSKGLSQAAVVAQFGEPARRSDPNGEPPISRWHYPEFVVYFEGDTVIHSVAIHTPQHQAAETP